MGFLSQRVERSDLKAGDHIYTWRAAFAYAHHGIYVGHNQVVHFTHNIISSSSGPSFSSSGLSTRASVACPHIRDAYDGLPFDGSSGVIISCLDCFLKTGSLYRYEYGVGGLSLILKLRGGTCTTAEPDPPETVVRRAFSLLREGFFEYNLVTNNCEDFALYCKTGHLAIKKKGKGVAPAGSSGQVRSRKSLGPIFLWKRYEKDIGVRDDVIKMRVEALTAYRIVFENWSVFVEALVNCGAVNSQEFWKKKKLKN